MSKPIVVIILILAGIVIGFLVAQLVQRQKKKTSITSSLIESRLSDCSDLTTTNLMYVDLVKYEDGTIPWMTKKSFSMIYQANIRAGIDLSKAIVKVTPKTVRIEMPETEIQSIEIDTDSLRFYDEHFALFNWNNKEDISNAIQMAREDAQKHIDFEQLKAQARKQAEAVISKLIKPTIGSGRTLEII
ncbi:MAG: DUF4230 domain-containing protein [Solobacterium sp.]|nr:DUF4230 domain-containing protein [Solobacterium sp.]